tara:strand:+ start:394 stop:639 length:246 start_codon:yes stop_codon:yes gene_type:complete
MSEEKRYIKQSGIVQERGQTAEEIEKEKILNNFLEGGSLEGKEGGLRVDMFEHDDPDDLPCLCDLPYAAQELIYDEIEENK